MTVSSRRKYSLAFALGLIAGGVITAYATRAIPRMMTGMMRSMMTKMGGEGGNPADI